MLYLEIKSAETCHLDLIYLSFVPQVILEGTARAH